MNDVKEIMTSYPLTVSVDTHATKVRSIFREDGYRSLPVVADHHNITKVALIMIEYDIGRLPVVENPVYAKKEPNRAIKSDLVGIIAREDILWSYLG